MFMKRNLMQITIMASEMGHVSLVFECTRVAIFHWTEVVNKALSEPRRSTSPLQPSYLHSVSDTGCAACVAPGRSDQFACQFAADSSPPVPGPSAARQPGAGHGGHLAARGGLARDIGLDCDFAPFLQNRDVQRSAYVDKVVVVADVMGPL